MKKKATKTILIVVLAVLWPALAAAWPATTGQKSSKPGAGEERVARAIEVIKDLASMKEEGIPARLLEKAEGLAIFPGVVKAAWGIGGQYGRGIVMVRRKDGQWSNPLFIDLIGGSFGWQIGVQKADIVLVFKNRQGVENIASNKITLGADMSVSAGPVGRSAEASTDIEMEAEIYSYSKSKGLFAGIALKGGTLRVNQEANAAFYGSGLNPSKILYENIKTPVIVIRLHQTIEELSKTLNK
ncbi:MAG: lipid-binding SYLF domain-containing protein [Candidatus Saccharicenans sp.]|uniref:lipid-binding SYLF domain-containing protein n=1 Tax=Candidatus Saccharicenans sp. TaxID=2819258 RepID=UPI0040493EBE